MPTSPDTEFIPREYSSSEHEQLLRDLSGLCDEVVNFGSRAFQRCRYTPAYGDHYLPIFMLMRHSIEIVDSISILVLKSSVEPCKMLLRGLLETVLSIEWIISDRTEQRAKAYLIFKAHKELRQVERMDRSTQKGKAFFKDLRRNSSPALFANLKLDLADARTSKLNVIKLPGLQEAEDEYQKVLKLTGDHPKHWYSLFPRLGKNAPNTLESLARQVGHLDWYVLLYSFWSDLTHAGDVISGRIAPKSIDGNTLFYQIRLPRDANVIAFYAIYFGYQCIRQASKCVHEKLVPEVDNWFEREIKPALISLGKMKISFE